MSIPYRTSRNYSPQRCNITIQLQLAISDDKHYLAAATLCQYFQTAFTTKDTTYVSETGPSQEQISVFFDEESCSM